MEGEAEGEGLVADACVACEEGAYADQMGVLGAGGPNFKCFRSTQRAGREERECCVGYQLLEPYTCEGCGGAGANGAEACAPVLWGMRTCVYMGRRSKECWAYERGGYPEKPIGPITVI